MRINSIVFNNNSTAVKTNDIQKNSAKANLAFHSAVLQTADTTIQRILTAEKSPLLRSIRAFETTLRGNDPYAKALTSLTIAEEAKRLASIVYGISSSCENAIVDGITGKGFQSGRLSQHLAMSFEDLARTEIAKKMAKSTTIYGNTEFIAEEVAFHRSNIETVLNGLEGFAGLGNEKSGLTAKFKNTETAGDALREAAVYFRKLSAYFYEVAGKEQQRINERMLQKSLTSATPSFEESVHWNQMLRNPRNKFALHAQEGSFEKGLKRRETSIQPGDRILAGKQLSKGRPQGPSKPVELDLANKYYTEAALLASV